MNSKRMDIHRRSIELLGTLGFVAFGAFAITACRSDRAAQSPKHESSPNPPAAPTPAPKVPEPVAKLEFDANGIAWPVPKGWNSETIPFPLDFAPSLPLRGDEHLRFMPGFFDPKSPSFWSYDFVWWLAEKPKFDASSLSPMLEDYFRGLCTAVGQNKFAFDDKRFHAELVPKPGAATTTLVGTIASYDPFKTGEPIALNVEAHLCDCPSTSHFAIRFLISPAKLDSPVWTELRACEATLVCR